MFKKYYFYHITFYRLGDGEVMGFAMGTVYSRFLNPVNAYEKVKEVANEGLPTDHTWSIDTLHRN